MIISQKLRYIAAASSNITTAALSCHVYHSNCWFTRRVESTRLNKGHIPSVFKELRPKFFTVEIDKEDSRVLKERVFSVDRSGLYEGSVRRINQNELMDMGIGKGAKPFRLHSMRILKILSANRTIHSSGERTPDADIYERPNNITRLYVDGLKSSSVWILS
jgi:hypothetical protein